MGTRSRIGIKNQDGTIDSIYCHWDGYPSHNGVILNEHYNEEARVRELISLGSLSSLSPAISPEEGTEHSFNSPQEGVCVFYGRDRGEQEVEPRQDSNVKAFMDKAGQSWEEWMYLFNPENGQWEVAEAGDKVMRPLQDLIVN